MSSFEANLKTMPFAEQTILLRVFNSKDELMAILPNFPAKQGTLRVFSHVASTTGQIGRDEANEALRIFGEYTERAQRNRGLHQAGSSLNLRDGDFLKIERIESSYANLLTNIHDRKASAAESEAFIELLNRGKVGLLKRFRMNGNHKPM